MKYLDITGLTYLGGKLKALFASKVSVDALTEKVNSITQNDLIPHITDTTKHITAAERTAWNAKPTTANVNTAIGTHNQAADAHSDIRQAVSGKASPSDVDTKISTHNTASGAHSTLFNQKANATDLTAHTGNKANPHGVTKAQVGLGTVDNTSDMSKPVSTAMQNALNGKAPKYTYGTADLTPGVSPLAEETLYFVYE